MIVGWNRIKKIVRVIHHIRATVSENSYWKQGFCPRRHCPNEMNTVSTDWLKHLSWDPFLSSSLRWHIALYWSPRPLQRRDKYNALYTQKCWGHHLPCREDDLDFFGEGEKRCFHCMIVSFSLALSDEHKQVSLWVGKVQWKLVDLLRKLSYFLRSLISRVLFWLCFIISPTNRTKTFVIQCSFCRIFLNRSRDMFIDSHHSGNMVNLYFFLRCGCCRRSRSWVNFKSFPSSPKFSCSCLHSW